MTAIEDPRDYQVGFCHEPGSMSPLLMFVCCSAFQVDLFRKSCKENIIVYLPTGSGKTFIAALLIKEYASAMQKPLSHGGKRTVFLVPTVVLGQQQAEFLDRNLPLNIGSYNGSMNVDNWKNTR